MSQTPLDLNLAEHPFRNNTWPWAGLVAGALALILLTGWNGSSYRRHVRLLSEIKEEKNSIASQLVDLDRRDDATVQAISRIDVESLQVQADKANEVIGWKAFSWTRLFNRMEDVLPWNVHVISIRPIFRSRAGRDRVQFFTDKSKSIMVAIEGMSKNLDALLDLERALFEDSHFAQAEPEEYEVQTNRELMFTLRFAYYPLGKPGEQPDVMVAANPPEVDGGDAEADPADPQPETSGADEPAQGDSILGQREPPHIRRPAATDAAAAVADPDGPAARLAAQDGARPTDSPPVTPQADGATAAAPVPARPSAVAPGGPRAGPRPDARNPRAKFKPRPQRPGHDRGDQGSAEPAPDAHADEEDH